MRNETDRDLIRAYVRDRDHDAFAALVHRYIALVRSAAVRMTREPGLADDVTQAAMIVLARRARQIPPNVVLASWLYTVTHHLSQNAIKARARRNIHEARAASLHVQAHERDSELRDVLEGAIARLPDIERGGVVLHFFNDCTHAQIADVLGMRSEAVRKRVSRALVRLRDMLVRRGFDLSTATLESTLRAESKPAAAVSSLPVESIVSIALLSNSNASSAPAIMANGMLGAQKSALTSALKWKLAASLALASAGFSGIALIPLAPPAAQATRATIAQAPPATQPVGVVAQVTPKIKIEALACAPHPADPTQWFSVDGKPIDMPFEALTDNQVDTDSQPDRQIVFKLDVPAGVMYNIHIPNARTWSTSGVPLNGTESLYRCRYAYDGPGPETLTILFNVATEDWQTIARIEELKEETEIETERFGTLTFMPPAESQRWGTHVNMRHPNLEVMPQMFAIDKDGKEHVNQSINNDRDGGGAAQAMFLFDMPADQIKGVRLQVREFDKQVEFTGIAMNAEQHTEPKVVVKDLKPKK